MISRVDIKGLNSKEKVLHTQYFAIIKLVNTSKKSSYCGKFATGNYSGLQPIMMLTYIVYKVKLHLLKPEKLILIHYL